MTLHIPVLKDELINGLNLQKTDIVFDGTLGFGGHARAILAMISQGNYIGLDQDIDAINYCKDSLKHFSNITFEHSNFENISAILQKHNINAVDKLIVDLGMSSYQLSHANRGFSFQESSDLDMRMNQSNPLTAAEILNTYSAKELSDMFIRYAELRHHSKLVELIVQSRVNTPYKNTDDLIKTVKEVHFSVIVVIISRL